MESSQTNRLFVLPTFGLATIVLTLLRVNVKSYPKSNPVYFRERQKVLDILRIIFFVPLFLRLEINSKAKYHTALAWVPSVTNDNDLTLLVLAEQVIV